MRAKLFLYIAEMSGSACIKPIMPGISVFGLIISVVPNGPPAKKRYLSDYLFVLLQKKTTAPNT
jgi:hypothetical protein